MRIWILGLNNDIYFQVGLVTLIGLAAKNAILIVEFAKIQVDKGMEPLKAAMMAGKLRFRPILMTSLAFVLGIVLVPFFFVIIYKVKDEYKIPDLKFPRFLKRKKE